MRIINLIPRVYISKTTALLLICLFILYSCQQGNDKPRETVVLDNIKFDIDDGGVGFDTINDDSVDMTKPSFVAIVHIVNNTKKSVAFDSTNFKLTDLNGVQIPFTKLNGVDNASLYSQEIEAGKSGDFMLTFAVTEEGSYDLHLISPISKQEKIIRF